MGKRRKKWIGNLLRLLICAAALAFVARGVTLQDKVILADGSEPLVGRVVTETEQVVTLNVEGSLRLVPVAEIAVDEQGHPRVEYGLLTAWKQSRKLLLIVSLLLFLPVPVLQGVRMMVVLRAQGIRLGAWENIKLAFAGNFWNFAAPIGSTTGDVIKAYYISLHTPQRTEAVTTVVLDRVIGLVTLVLVVAILASLAPSGSPLAQFRLYTLGFLGAAAIGMIVYFSPALRRLVPHALVERLPLSDHLKRVDAAACALAKRRGIVFVAVLITATLQFAAVLSYFVVAMSVGMNANLGNLFEYYAYFSAGAVVQALPGPPQGLGTVELAYSYFFAAYGSISQIVCMALVMRLVVFAAALPGLPVILTGAYRPPPAEEEDDEAQVGEVSSPATIAPASQPDASSPVEAQSRP